MNYHPFLMKKNPPFLKIDNGSIDFLKTQNEHKRKSKQSIKGKIVDFLPFFFLFLCSLFNESSPFLMNYLPFSFSSLFSSFTLFFSSSFSLSLNFPFHLYHFSKLFFALPFLSPPPLSSSLPFGCLSQFFCSFFLWSFCHHYLWRCLWCNGYRRRKWTRRHEFKSWTKTDCISHSTNTLGKGMNPIILPPVMGK